MYASTTPLGAIGVESLGAVYQVKTQARDIGVQSRGVQLMEKKGGKSLAPAAAEFFEDKVVIKTVK